MMMRGGRIEGIYHCEESARTLHEHGHEREREREKERKRDVLYRSRLLLQYKV